MKKTNDDVIYLTRAEWEAFKRQEAEERMELVRRVERRELTAWQATLEASIFKGRIPSVLEQPINLADVLGKAKGLRRHKETNGRRRAKAVRA
ncbi:MAG: hypothetical protein HYY24_26470 [Verrucomicrobia bacterium]|nr:hypothetical protein [Verrucomicrobiota bacterium]